MFANSHAQPFFEPAATQQSVIVRSQPGQNEGNEDGNYPGPSPFSQASYGSTVNTPITPSYQAYNPMQFPFIFGTDWNFFPQPSPGDSNCSGGQLGAHQLQSPILGNTAIGGSLNPLQQRFGAYPNRGALPYELNTAGQFMGGGKPQKGGRRPRDLEMDDINDPDEADKRLKRRLRNKEAAARCRQRRLDLMNSLQDTVDQVKAENDRKENDIRNIINKVNQLVEFLKPHESKMTPEERNNLNSIISSFPSSNSMIGRSNGGGNNYKMEDMSSSSVANDYQPQRQQQQMQQQHQNGKRPLNTLPPTSAISLLEPDTKMPKLDVDSDPMFSGSANEDNMMVSRPTRIDLGSLPEVTRPTTIVNTPSNMPSFKYYNARDTYDNSFGFGQTNTTNNLLSENTGLTPVGQPAIHNHYIGHTPTLSNTDPSDLKSL